MAAVADRHDNFQLRFRPGIADDWGLMVDAIGEQPVMVTANQVARARSAFAAHLIGRPGFRIDPVPYRLESVLGWTEGRHGTKAAYQRLEAEFGHGLDFRLIGPRLRWADLSTAVAHRYVDNVLRFQASYLLHETRESLRLFAPAAFMEVERGLRPAALLAPYVLIDDRLALSDQRALWRETTQRWDDAPVELVVAVEPSFMRNVVLMRELVEAVAATHHDVVWLWFVGESRLAGPSLADRVRAERRAVRALSDVGKTVRLLHSGFFEMALSYDGASETAFGMGMQSGRVKAGGGPELGLFYSLTLHRNVWYPDARSLLHRCRTAEDLANELCACDMCIEAFSTSPGQYEADFFAGAPLMRHGHLVLGQETASRFSASLNRFHRLYVRSREALLIRAQSRRQLATALAATVMRMSRADTSSLHHAADALMPESA